MSTIMKRVRLLVATLGVVGFCGIADAQQQEQFQTQNQDGFIRRGRGNNNNSGNFGLGGGGGGGGGGGRNRQRFNNNAPVEVTDGDYSIIATKSIFMRDRRDRNIPTGPAIINVRDLPPEQLLVVTGIVFEDGGFHAYVEHLLQGGLTRLTVGNAVAKGVVTEISIDKLGYKAEGAEKIEYIGVSHNLLNTRIDSIQAERLRLQTMTGTGPGGGGNFRSEQFNTGTFPTPQFNQQGQTGQFQFQQRGGGGQFGNNNNNNNGGLGGGGRGNRGANAIPVVAPPPLVGDPNMSIEERMRARRNQEAQPGYQAPPPVVVEAPAEQPQAQQTPAAAAPGTAVDVSSLTNLTVEERMMLRRQQELGQ